MKPTRALCLLSLFVSAQSQGNEDGVVEIDFEPMGPGDIGPVFIGPEGPPGPEGPGPRKGPQALDREGELDQVLQEMLSPPDGPDDVRGGRFVGGPGDKVFNDAPPEGELIIEDDGPIPADMRSRIPGAAIRDLFPPAQVQVIDEQACAQAINAVPPCRALPPVQACLQDPTRGICFELIADPPPECRTPEVMAACEDGRPAGSDGPPGVMPPDAIMEDMMREMDQAFREQVLPVARRAAGEDGLPDSCSREIKTYCKGAPSQLHCLGKHAGDISEGCRKDVGKSVPFLCSDAIDRYCDVLTGGILSCLSGQLPSLEGPCKDAVVTTRHIIKKSNTQKASVTDPKSGQRKTITPQAANPQQREASLDAKLSTQHREASLDEQLSSLKHSATKPAPQRKLGGSLLDVSDHHDENKHPLATAHYTRPPLAAVLVPLMLLIGGFGGIFYFRPDVAAKLFRSRHDADARPLTAGTELVRPIGMA